MTKQQASYYVDLFQLWYNRRPAGVVPVELSEEEFGAFRA
jgi:hypothetical protein